MSIAAKFSDDPLVSAEAAFSEIIKGVVQLWRFFSHCRRAPKIKALSREPAGMLLTLDPWLQMSRQHERVFEEARKLAGQIDHEIIEEDCKSVLFCSIDDFENTLESASEDSLIEAIRATSRPEFQGWFLFNVHQRTSVEERRNPYPFASRVADILPGWNEGALAPEGDN